MKKTILLASICLTSLTTSAFATELCPAETFVHYSNYTAPQGWHTTRAVMSKDPLDVRNPNLKLSFYSAAYNHDHDKGANNNSISCYYFSDNSETHVEITTDRTGFPNPLSTKGTKWVKLGEGTAVCGFPLGDAEPADCPWG